MSFTLRPLRLTDLDEIEQIERVAYRSPWSRGMFTTELGRATSRSVAAVDAGGALVGYLILSRYVDAWHVMNVAVAPAWRRRGVATALLEHVFETTQADARRGYTLEVRVSNDAAIALYERLGFRRSGVRRGYYTDNREDAVIMWRDPTSPDTVGAAAAGEREREEQR
jgi:ribosomal-protein-alanine N-acetyltransferase